MSVGSVLLIFPVERLDIIEVAGDVLSAGQASRVLVSLPFGSPTSQTVTAQARGFDGLVPIMVALTPDTGDPITGDSEFDITVGDPSSVVVPVELPVHTLTRISWVGQDRHRPPEPLRDLGARLTDGRLER